MDSELFNNFVMEGEPSLIGRPDGQFITSSKQLNRIIAETKGDPVAMAERLGIEDWNSGTTIVRMDVESPLWHDPRFPTGSESGANSLFIPGGQTSGGVSEIIINPVPRNEVWWIIIETTNK